MEWALAVLGIQGVLGAYDNFRNHEFHEGLPIRVSQWRELYLHAARQGLYMFLFPTMAWLEWHGVWAYCLGGVIVAELFVTCWDFVEEDKTRKLSANERVLHTILTLNYGMFLGFFIPVLIDWSQSPSTINFVDRGFWSWLMTIYSLGVFLFGLREFIAGRSLYLQRFSTRDMSIHQEILGTKFDDLPECLKSFHREAVSRVFQGQLMVDTGSGLLKALLGFTGLPQISGLQKVSITIQADGNGELWMREFPNCRFVSRFEICHRSSDPRVVEKFGPIDLLYSLSVANGAILWCLDGCRLFGMPLPKFLYPRVSAREFASSEGEYSMRAEVAVPVFGNFISYDGVLTETKCSPES